MTTAELKSSFPEFTSVSDALILRAMAVADCKVVQGACSVAYGYLVASVLVVTQNQSSGKSDMQQGISQMSDGSLSVSFTQSEKSKYDDTMFANSYGQMYLSMTRGLYAGGFIVC